MPCGLCLFKGCAFFDKILVYYFCLVPFICPGLCLYRIFLSAFIVSFLKIFMLSFSRILCSTCFICQAESACGGDVQLIMDYGVYHILF